MAVGAAFPGLQGHNFLLLTTFRKTGVSVPTPVWFAQEGERLYVMTNPDAGKVKRIRNNAQVEVAPCDARGAVLGASAEAMARLLPESEAARADALLNKKYGLQKWLFDLPARLRGRQRAYIEITPM